MLTAATCGVEETGAAAALGQQRHYMLTPATGLAQVYALKPEKQRAVA